MCESDRFNSVVDHLDFGKLNKKEKVCKFCFNLYSL